MGVNLDYNQYSCRPKEYCIFPLWETLVAKHQAQGINVPCTEQYYYLNFHGRIFCDEDHIVCYGNYQFAAHTGIVSIDKLSLYQFTCDWSNRSVFAPEQFKRDHAVFFNPARAREDALFMDDYYIPINQTTKQLLHFELIQPKEIELGDYINTSFTLGNAGHRRFLLQKIVEIEKDGVVCKINDCNSYKSCLNDGDCNYLFYREIKS